jgi:sugar/nucleoside kinase (ribokinase family)
VVGDLVQDITALLRAPIAPSAQVTARLIRSRGGSAANIAAHLQSQGVSSRFYGRVGADQLGDTLCRLLAERGVSVRARRFGSTGTVICLVEPDGQRSFVADTSTEEDRNLSDLPTPELVELDLLHLSGYWLLSGIDLYRLASPLNALHPRPCLTVDLGDVSCITARGSLLLSTIELLKPAVVFANQIEAAEAGILDSLPVGTTYVVTAGGNASMVATPEGRTFIPVPPLESVRNTTGAGDAFIAGFLAAATRANPLEEAVKAGHSSARDVLSHGAVPDIDVPH